MQSDSSTHGFLKRLAERDREITTQLYSNYKGKENVISQPQAKPIKVSRRTKTQSSLILTHGQPEKLHYLDTRSLNHQQTQSHSFINNWFCLPQGIVEFTHIIANPHTDTEHPSAHRPHSFDDELSKIMQEGDFLAEEGGKSITIEIWSPAGEGSFVELLLTYALPFLKLGKGVWSVAALTGSKRHDLLSLQAEGCSLWKGKTPLSRVQLQRQPLMRRVFGFSAEKERTLGEHQTLAKLQLSNNNRVYFIIRDPTRTQVSCSAQLLVEQEVVIQNISTLCSLSVLRLEQKMLDEGLTAVMGRVGLRVKKEEELSKQERERFLRCMIEKLQGQLNGKQEELKMYKSGELKQDEGELQQKDQQKEQEEQMGIPSERISMGQQRYLQLKRQIKQGKVL